MRLLLIDSKPNNPNHYLVRAVYEAFTRSSKVTWVKLVDYRDAISIAGEEPFDCLFVFDGEEANNPIIRRLCELAPKRVIWFTEDPFEFKVNEEVAPYFDLIFSNDSISALRYGRKGQHLPLAADPASHFVEGISQSPRFDLFFAGSAWPSRLEFLRDLKGHLPDLRFKLVLVSNSALDPHIAGLKEGFEFSDGVSVREFSRLANASSVTLVLGRAFSGSDSSNPESDTPGPRLFEAALAGACQLVDSQALESAKCYFEEGTEILSFSGVEDCAAQIEALVADAKRRQAIAEKAQSHCQRDHLYDNRVATILEAVESLPARHVSISQDRKKPKVLFVTHNVIPHGYFGGSEIYLDEIRKTLEDYEVLILSYDHRSAGSIYRLYDQAMQEIETFNLSPAFRVDEVINEQLEMIFQKIIAQQAVEIVHFNHLLSFPFSLPIIAKAMGAKTLFTFHDYFTVCESFNLLDYRGRFCRILERPETTCDSCRLKSHGLAAGSSARRRRFAREMMRSIDVTILECESSRQVHEGLFPIYRGERLMMAPPIPNSGAIERQIPEVPEKGPLKIAFLGNFTFQKGGETALELFKALKGSSSFEFHIFGRIDAAYEKSFKEMELSNVTLHGPYQSGQPPKALADCHLALFLSIWPETYCMTLSEAWGRGLVPVVTDVGALGDRVEHGANGFKVPIGDHRGLAELLRSLSEDRGRLKKVQSQLPSRDEASITSQSYSEDLGALYRRLLNEQTERAPCKDYRRLFMPLELGIFFESRHWAKPEPGAEIPTDNRTALIEADASRFPKAVGQAGAYLRPQMGRKAQLKRIMELTKVHGYKFTLALVLRKAASIVERM